MLTGHAADVLDFSRETPGPKIGSGERLLCVVVFGMPRANMELRHGFAAALNPTHKKV